MNITNVIFEELKNLGIKNIGLTRDDGTFIETTFNKSAQKIISKIVFKNREIPVNNYIKQKLVRDSRFLYLYKVAYNGFCIFVSSLKSDILVQKLRQITNQYGFHLFNLFKSKNKNKIPKIAPKFTVNEPISVLLISKNRDFMPEPIAWIPTELGEVEALKIANKALLLILSDTEQITECYSLIHFIKRKQLGLIYLFEYPNKIRTVSATLTILFNENSKKAILTNIEEIEIEIKTFLDENRKNFNFSSEKLKSLHDKIISTLNKPKIEQIYEDPIRGKSTDRDLKEAMIRAIKRIKMPKKVGKNLKKSNLKAEMVKTIKRVKNQV
ncbi:MAG: hypothetical protein ACTSRG_08915 [Candidatus Helarchaeota archaeon]